VSASRFLPAQPPSPSAPGPGALALLVRGLEVLVEEVEGGGRRLPSLAVVQALSESLHLLGTLEGQECWAGPPLSPGEPPAGTRFVPARSLYGEVDEALFGVVGRALAVVEWDVMHRYCGRCAGATRPDGRERARVCPACESRFYPRLSPAVIVAVEREGQLLLARPAGPPRPWASVLAGFVEPGESLEETVVREVREEVGIAVSDVRYFGSQPWPFGRSLMVGFTAKWAGGALQVDGVEIAEAGWYAPEALPPLPPPLSIARRLIDDFLARSRPGKQG
jgi:NAD+ diphosphatase